MTFNIDTATEAQVIAAIEASEDAEVVVTSAASGGDTGVAYLEGGEVFVRWESGVTTPAMFAA
jgi:hypothetical protein